MTAVYAILLIVSFVWLLIGLAVIGAKMEEKQ